MRAWRPLGHVKSGEAKLGPNDGQAAYVDGAEDVDGDDGGGNHGAH